jgi:hypothetical protein
MRQGRMTALSHWNRFAVKCDELARETSRRCNGDLLAENGTYG